MICVRFDRFDCCTIANDFRFIMFVDSPGQGFFELVLELNQIGWCAVRKQRRKLEKSEKRGSMHNLEMSYPMYVISVHRVSDLAKLQKEINL